MKKIGFKPAVVVTGNIRDGANEVLALLHKHFPIVILSTWEDEKKHIPKGENRVILNKRPKVGGYNNRNFQRLSAGAGIDLAARLGATHILKWRTDMLPTKINVTTLLNWSQYKVPLGVSSRIVTCTFRNLSVNPDYFSSIPDLFHFSDTEMMKLLWDTKGFDFSKEMNLPKGMTEECGTDWINTPDPALYFCVESEVYAQLRSRLEKKVKRKLDHPTIAKKYLYLFDHEKLGICWFGANHTFRSIFQAAEHPWWTEETWKSESPTIIGRGYPVNSWKRFYSKAITWYKIKNNIAKQRTWYVKHLANPS